MAPLIVLNPTSLLIVSAAEASVPVVQVHLTNGGSGTIQWMATPDPAIPAWLSVFPGSGSGAEFIDVFVDTTGLIIGTYVKNIVVTSSNATNSPQILPVTLTISDFPRIHPITIQGIDGVPMMFHAGPCDLYGYALKTNEGSASDAHLFDVASTIGINEFTPSYFKLPVASIKPSHRSLYKPIHFFNGVVLRSHPHVPTDHVLTIDATLELWY